MSRESAEAEKQVLMARSVARRWLSRVAQEEFRLRVIYGSREYRNLPNLLRAFRDGKVAIQGVPTIPDLGVKDDFDGVEVWTRDREAMLKLGHWFEGRGLDTTGVW